MKRQKKKTSPARSVTDVSYRRPSGAASQVRRYGVEEESFEGIGELAMQSMLPPPPEHLPSREHY